MSKGARLPLVLLLQILCLTSTLVLSSKSPDDKAVNNRQFFEGMDFANMDLSNLDPSDMGDDFGDGLDFICNNFCGKSEEGCDGAAVKTEDLIEEISNLKDLLTAQTATVMAMTKFVISRPTGSDVIPIEYRPAYPVFSLSSDYGHYQFTLSDAREACQNKGAQLATYEQMLAAWERGMDMCSCGWIEEGYAIYPIWYARDGCTNKIGPGIRYNCTWQRTWNAWCFSKDIANKLA